MELNRAEKSLLNLALLIIFLSAFTLSVTAADYSNITLESPDWVGSWTNYWASNDQATINCAKVKGATDYLVFRSNNSAPRTMEYIGKMNSERKYYDKPSKSGTYYYWVRATEGQGYSKPKAASKAITIELDSEKTITAFNKIEAEDYTKQSGIRTQPCSEGTDNVGWVNNGDYLFFANLDFARGAREFAARVASNTAGGNIELRIDGLNGKLVGKLKVEGTNGWQHWVTKQTATNKVTGVHDLYLKFTGSGGSLLNINYFKFNKDHTDPRRSSRHERIFTNLSEVNYYSTDVVFIDAMKRSGAWRKKDWSPYSAGELELGQNGWVKSLKGHDLARTIVILHNNGHYVKGEYTLCWKGQGKFRISGADKRTITATGASSIKVDLTGNGGLVLDILATDVQNHLKDFKLLLPGFENSYYNKTFHPQFIEYVEKFGGVRFMDWMHTNDSQVQNWKDRTSIHHKSYASEAAGVPYQLTIDLVNQANLDGWWCIPHGANDRFIRNFLRLLRDKVEKNRKIYIEYSNETWNGMFAQSQYCHQQAQKIGLKNKHQYHGYRAQQIFEMIDQVFGSEKDRVVKVVAAQSANSWTAKQVLQTKDVASTADVLAIAPYFGGGLGRSGGKKDPNEVKRWSVDQLEDWLYDVAMPDVFADIEENKKVADKYGVDLVAYEGGQHLVGVGKWTNDQQLTKLFQRMNRDLRMYDLYTEYLDGWEERGGDTFAVFSSTNAYSKWGSWGIKEYYNQPLQETPKYEAIINWIY